MLSNEDRLKVDEYRLLMANVYELAALSRRQSEAIASELGVTVTQWHTMSVLSGAGATVPQIARRLGVTRQAVQRVADQLARSGHISRTANPRHGTSPVLQLTPLGGQTLHELWEASDSPRAEMLHDVHTSDLHAAASTLGEVLAAFRNQDA